MTNGDWVYVELHEGQKIVEDCSAWDGVKNEFEMTIDIENLILEIDEDGRL